MQSLIFSSTVLFGGVDVGTTVANATVVGVGGIDFAFGSASVWLPGAPITPIPFDVSSVSAASEFVQPSPMMVGPEEVDSSTELPHARIVIVRTDRITN